MFGVGTNKREHIHILGVQAHVNFGLTKRRVVPFFSAIEARVFALIEYGPPDLSEVGIGVQPR